VQANAKLTDPGFPPSDDGELQAWVVRNNYYEGRLSKMESLQEKVSYYAQIIDSLLKTDTKLAAKEIVEDSEKFKRTPKVNTTISTIPKLTKKYLESHQAWRWLEIFSNEIDPYAQDQETKILYLKSSVYVDSEVWGDQLEGLPYPHTFEGITSLLDSMYPDKRSYQERLLEFTDYVQDTPFVSEYFRKKELKWSIATDIAADETQVLFLEEVLKGLCPRIRKKIFQTKTMKSVKDEVYSYTELKSDASLLETILKEYPETNVEYLKQFRVGVESSKDKKIDLSKICFATQRGEKCVRVNCPYSHKSTKVNAVSTTAKSASSKKKAPIDSDSLDSSEESSEIDQQVANVNSSGGKTELNDKSKYQFKPDALCVRCSKTGDYDGHYGIDCPRAWCGLCSSWGHTKHRCKESTCDCGAKGHTNYSHGVMPKGFSKGSV
jgi:hypothetical protein